MRTQEYLNQLNRFEQNIMEIMSEINRYYDVATSTSIKPKEIDVQTSGSQDPMGDAVSKIVDKKVEMEHKIDEVIKTRTTIIEQIDSIEEIMQYKILSQRYIQRFSWKDIECNMKISHRHCMRLHNEALNEFEKKFGVLYLHI